MAPIPFSAVAAQWQLCVTYFFAFTISTGFFETQRSLYTVGIISAEMLSLDETQPWWRQVTTFF